MLKYLFTVVTVTYNSSKWVKQAIESVLTSNYTDFEYLILDDCSSDETWDIVRKYNDPRIVASRNETNIGEYANRNKALNVATGSYIIYIDGDDILYKSTLGNLKDFIKAFPDADMIWGVSQNALVLFPYLFKSDEIVRINLFSHIGWCNIGFAETLFKTIALRRIGGFSEKYAIGDVYIKKKLSISSRVLLVPIGFSHWRVSENQASKRAKENYRAFKDNFLIDISILKDPQLPLTDVEKEVALNNVMVRTVKILLAKTLLKGQFLSFFKVFHELKLKPLDLLLVFKQGQYHFNTNPEVPLMNDYNFTNIKLK